MKILGTSRNGGRILCGLMIVWCPVMFLAVHEQPASIEAVLPLAVLFIYGWRWFACRKQPAITVIACSKLVIESCSTMNGQS